MVRENWAKFKHRFHDFNIAKLSKIRADKLLQEPTVIKNRKKVEAIIYDVKEFRRISKEYGSFSNFLKSLKAVKDREAFKILMKRFKHVGEYTAECYLTAWGTGNRPFFYRG